ncbi:MAG: hypothetical protein ACI9P3_000399 [Bradyrhizobium sp.]|jgi:hypothetical protein
MCPMRRLLGAAPRQRIHDQARDRRLRPRRMQHESIVGQFGARNGILLGKRMCARQRRDMGLIEDQALREPGFGW